MSDDGDKNGKKDKGGKSSATKLGKLLRSLANVVDQHPELAIHLELEDLLAPSHLKPQTRKKTKKGARKFDLKLIREQLELAQTRQKGLDLIDEAALTKSDLEVIARAEDLPVQREDTVERLRSRIVEHMIGARLRSKAIREGES